MNCGIIKIIKVIIISILLIAVVGIPIEIISLVLSYLGLFNLGTFFNGGINMTSKTLYRMMEIGTDEVILLAVVPDVY